ncbi:MULTISPECIES: iron-containing alcohol dehydrogenase [unclassified Agarivorans]|uniref:iron-containing alcohol dehydrogenase n=1 Tax=unclassified Agarivorans TaxID=2636026 RepID=UPI003D7C77F2
MLNFSFQNTTQIHFGEGQIANIQQQLPADARVLLTYGGGSIKNNGVYQQVTEALAGHHWVEFSGIEPNPQYKTLIKAVELIKTEQLDYILAVGGGSVIDGSKFIAAAALYQGDDPWDIIAKRHPVDSALPLGAVLTLPATGSETNAGAVVTRDGNKLPFMAAAVRPQFAILDPSVTLSLSPRQVSNGVVDAFVHVMEQYLTYPVNGKIQDRFAEGILLTLIEEGPKALAAETKDNIEVRANIMWAASMALNGLIGAGVPQDWASHMLGHELTAAFGVDHARSLSITLPAVMKIRRETKAAKLLQYAERIWGITEGDEPQRIEQAIAATEAFFKAMQVPTRLSEIDLGDQDVELLLAKLEQHQMLALGEDQQINLDLSRQIYQAAL